MLGELGPFTAFIQFSNKHKERKCFALSGLYLIFYQTQNETKVSVWKIVWSLGALVVALLVERMPLIPEVAVRIIGKFN